MDARDRLKARAFLIDELYHRATLAETRAAQAEARVAELEQQLAGGDEPCSSD